MVRKMVRKARGHHEEFDRERLSRSMEGIGVSALLTTCIACC